jgi:hypothetical protein
MAEAVSSGGGELDMPDFSPQAGCESPEYRLFSILELSLALLPRDRPLPILGTSEVIGGRPFGGFLAKSRRTPNWPVEKSGPCGFSNTLETQPRGPALVSCFSRVCRWFFWGHSAALSVQGR